MNKEKKSELPDEIWDYIKYLAFDWKRSHKQKLNKVIFSFPEFCWEMRPIYSETTQIFPPFQNTNDIIRDVYNVMMYWDEEEEPPPNLQLTSITRDPRNGGYWKYGYGWYKQGCL